MDQQAVFNELSKMRNSIDNLNANDNQEIRKLRYSIDSLNYTIKKSFMYEYYTKYFKLINDFKLNVISLKEFTEKLESVKGYQLL